MEAVAVRKCRTEQSERRKGKYPRCTLYLIYLVHLDLSGYYFGADRLGGSGKKKHTEVVERPWSKHDKHLAAALETIAADKRVLYSCHWRYYDFNLRCFYVYTDEFFNSYHFYSGEYSCFPV